MSKTALEIVEEHAKLKDYLDSLVISMKRLRDGRDSWRDNIEKDTRPAIGILHDAIKYAENNLATFEKTVYVVRDQFLNQVTGRDIP